MWVRYALLCVALGVCGLFLDCVNPISKEPPSQKEAPVPEPPRTDVPLSDASASDVSASDVLPQDTTEPKVTKLPRTWTGTLPALDQEKRQTYPYVRSIIHLHSIYSHDACDGNPRVDGKKNLPCLKRLREALCIDQIDVVFLTEHRSLMAEGDPIDQMMLHQEGDKKLQDGNIIANQITCANGHIITVFPGAENALMPVALQRHPTPLQGQSLSQLYNDTSAEAIKQFQQAGAAVIVNHTEGRSLEYLQTHDIHGIEIYNLHAIIDPRIRKSDLNLPQQGALEAFLMYLHPEDMKLLPHPDLVFLGFHEPLKVILDKWDRLLAQKMVYGYGGTDAHENVLKTLLKDGDRPDSYGRMMRWFSNHLQVKEKTVQAYREALFAGRSIVVFEVLGTPDVFEFYGETTEGKRVEMGATTSAVLKYLKVEAKHPYAAGEEKVESEIRLFHITADGSKEVARKTGSITLENPSSGVYRAEVWVVPRHLKYIVTPKTPNYMRSYPWIYSNPIRIE